MSDEDYEVLFSHINAIKDRLDDIDNKKLNKYVITQLINNKYCSIDDEGEYK